MKQPLTTKDVVAANMRNAFFDELPASSLFPEDDRDYEKFDAQVLEVCYKKTDELGDENVDLLYTEICSGRSIKFDTEKQDFFLI